MKLDPQTTIDSLLVAIPSSSRVFGQLGIKTDGNESKSLKQACAERGIDVGKFLAALEEIDWGNESLGH